MGNQQSVSLPNNDAGPPPPPQKTLRFGRGDAGTRGDVIGTFHNFLQGSNEAIITVSSNAIENFNIITGDRRKKVIPPSPLLCTDFNPRTQCGAVLVAGTSNGNVYIFNAHDFRCALYCWRNACSNVSL